MNSYLDEAQRDLLIVRINLREAARDASQQDRIALASMIERAEILRNDVAAFLAARRADEGRG